MRHSVAGNTTISCAARLRRVPEALKFPGRLKTPGASRFAVWCTRNAVSQCDKLSHPVSGLRPAVILIQRCCHIATYNPRLCRARPGSRSSRWWSAVADLSHRFADSGAVAPPIPLRGSGYCAAVAARRPALSPLLSEIGLDLESRSISIPPGGNPGKRGPYIYP